MDPVVFQHWIHRSMFTCRVCHVDVGFGMKAGATGIKAIDNERGYYCGACHNGKKVVDGKTVFQACSTKATYEDQKRCDRCHSLNKKMLPVTSTSSASALRFRRNGSATASIGKNPRYWD